MIRTLAQPRADAWSCGHPTADKTHKNAQNLSASKGSTKGWEANAKARAITKVRGRRRKGVLRLYTPA